jgi:hypothetical protein
MRGVRRGSLHWLVALLCLAVGMALFAAPAALAAAPEAPKVTEGGALPDERTYELVSPPGEGEPYLPPINESSSGFTTNLPFKAAADGDAVVWAGEPATLGGTSEIAPTSGGTSGGTGETGPGAGNEWLSTRGSEGWTSSDITPAGTREFKYEGFSGSLENAFAQGSIASSENESAECHGIFSRSIETGALSSLFAPSEFSGACGHPLFAGTSQDESQVIFQDEAALTSEAEPAVEVPPNPEHQHFVYETGQVACMFGCNLYDLKEGHLKLVNVLEDKPVPNATFGGYAGAGARALTTFSHAISNDGSRIFWTDTQAGPDMEHVYALINGSETVAVSAGAAEYWTATRDGHYAFYTENGELWRFDTDTRERVALLSASDEATGTGELREPATGTDEIKVLSTTSGHFHEGEEIFGLGIPAGTTIIAGNGSTLRLSKAFAASESDLSLTAGGPEVQGVVGINETGEDGAYIYFAADGSLAGESAKTCTEAPEYQAQLEREFLEGDISQEQDQREAEQSNKEEAEERQGLVPPRLGCGLYLLHGGSLIPIATLAPSDARIKIATAFAYSSDWVANLSERIAQVAPDGNHLVFESHRPLTGYDNDYEGNPQINVFVYSALGAQLTCASCNPTGAPPLHQQKETLLPQASAANYTYMPQLISENGNRVFFETREPLSPQDTNGALDVYEWEREGEGTCEPATPTRPNDGCLFLLSGGVSPQASVLIGPDSSGENVFFEHVGALGQLAVPSDHNLLYDARIRGGFTKVSLSCTGTGCQGVPPGPPIFATPASVTFSGIGNFPALAPGQAGLKSAGKAQKLAKALSSCGKERKKRARQGCKKRARKQYGAKQKPERKSKTKKAGNERRTQS